MPHTNTHQYALFESPSSTVRPLLEIKREITGFVFRAVGDIPTTLIEQLIIVALQRYWECLQNLHGTKLPFSAPNSNYTSAPEKDAANLFSELGAALATLPVEFATYEIGQLYTSLLPVSLRSEHGIFYTPPALAARMIENAAKAGVDWKKAQIIDPACGGGAFLVPATQQIIKALGDANPAMIARNLRTRLEGWEIGQFAASLSRFFIEVAAISITAKTGKLIEPNIQIMDSLKCPEKDFSRFDLVIGNPPFGRMRLDADMRERYSRSLYGHANLYGMFTELAVRLAKNGGIITYLTPASFLAGGYFKNLRSLLWEESPPLSIDFVESRKGVFDGVLQETVLATYRKSAKKNVARISVINHDMNGLIIASAGTLELPSEPTFPWILARNSKDESIVSQLQKLPDRLKDWGYTVSTGPLVWNRYKDQLRDEKTSHCMPIIWSESVSSDGQFTFRSEKKNHQPYFKITGKQDDWLKVKRECVLLQRTTAKEQKRRLIAAVLPSEFIKKYAHITVENHLNMIYPIIAKPVISVEVLSAFLNSEAADRAFRCLSGSVAVSAYELESLPLPNKKQLSKLTKLVTSNASKEAIEIECRALYEGVN